MMRRSLLAVLLLLGSFCAAAQSDSAAPASRAHWTALWIAHPSAPLREPGVVHFRKIVRLDARPAKFLVQVSADNRFALFVNGLRIGEGPARGDLAHWRYETFDLAPALHAGANVLAATVWNYGVYAPLAQISNRTAFLMQGDTDAESLANTDPSWQAETEPGWSFIPRQANGFWSYWAAGPGERLDMNRYDWSWLDENSGPASHWVAAIGAVPESIYPQSARPSPRDENIDNPWRLMADPLPPMDFALVDPGKVVRTDLPSANAFPASPVVVPPHTSAEVLLDHGTMVTGFPELVVSDGAGSKIRVGYTEALYDSKQQRSNRNEVGDLQVLGQFDELLPDGGSQRVFQPLTFRTWRYLQLKIETGDAPLTLDRLAVHFSAYPFQERARFTSSDSELEKIWQICWRTARIDAHETYMDTAFWEQLQYIDDTRIQALISYTVAGDDRLALQALRAFDASRVPEGITQSRYPSLLPQFIPNFSLSYIGMIHDEWIYRPDAAIVRELLPGTRPILEWFFRHQLPDGFLTKLPYWMAVDDPPGLTNFPHTDRDGRSALVTLLFVDALHDAADLESAFGDPALAARYRAIAQKSAAAVYAQCWNAKLGLLADTPDRNSYSQHTNIFGILTDAVPAAAQPDVMKKLLAAQLGHPSDAGADMIRASIHYQFHLSRAIDKLNLGDSYLATLAPWRKMLSLGLTTTPEYMDPTRSDTHAWSAHPIYDLLTIVAGIHPAAPAFARVRIAPHPGPLTQFDAAMPHPQGEIRVAYRLEARKANFTIVLPEKLSGSFQWRGQSLPLHGGSQSFVLPAEVDAP